MKQYDSYLIFGCHFPRNGVNLILLKSSLEDFNRKIRLLYNCEIIEMNIPISDDNIIKQYYLRICIEQSDNSIIKIDKLSEVDIKKFGRVLNIFEMDIEPYLIGIPIVRELPDVIYQL